MGRRRRRILMLALAAWLLPALALAHSFDVFGYGSRAAALGGAYTALADGYEAAYYNPAGVVRTPGVRLGIGYSQSFSDLELNGQALELRDTVQSGVTFGVSGAGKLYEHGVGFSVAFALPDRGSIRGTVLGPTDPNFVLLSNRVQRAEILISGGVEILRGLAVGGGIAIGAELGGSVELDSTLFPEAVDGSAEVPIQTRIFPVLGVQFDAWDTLRLGLAYRGETELSIGLPAAAVIAVSPGSPLSADLLLELSQTFFFSPHQIIVGFAHDPYPGFTLSFDLMWADWSSFGDPGSTGSLVVEGALGGLLDVPNFRASAPPRFHDIFVPRLGLEYRPPAAPFGLEALRLGYFFEPTPAPAADGVRNLLDNDKHVISAGLGFAFRDPWGILLADAHLDLHGQYFRYATREVEKLDPTDPIGDLRFGGDRWVLGGMLTFEF